MDFELSPLELAEGIDGLRVSGELDLLAAPTLKERLNGSIEQGAGFVLLNLSEATFIDSTILGVLVGANRRALEKDGAMMLVCNNAGIRTIFTLTLLDRVFDIFDADDEGLAALEALREARAADSTV